MKQIVAKCPNINLMIVGQSQSSVLDSGSMVSLMWQYYFNRYLRLWLGPTKVSVADAHHMFDLKSASGGEGHCADM